MTSLSPLAPLAGAAATWRPLVALEGPSGSGKSTLLPLVSERLLARSIIHTLIANNAVEPWAPLIRNLANEEGRPLSLAYATAAARAQIRETTLDGMLVVSDRFVLSTLVYQVYAGIDLDTVYAINEPLLFKTTTIILEVDELTLEARRHARLAAGSDRFKRLMSISEELRLYSEAAKALETRRHKVVRISADIAPDILAEQIAELIVLEVIRGNDY